MLIVQKFLHSFQPLSKTKLLFTLFCCTVLLVNTQSPASDFLVFQKQGRKLLPKVNINNQVYLPLTDLLQALSLSYSESASADTFTISSGNNTVKLTKDRSQAQLNEGSIGLNAPVLLIKNQWLVSLDFVNRVLNRIVADKIVVSSSGNRICLGTAVFNKMEIKTYATEQGTKVLIQFSAPLEAEVKPEDSRIIFVLGNAPIDPAKEDFQVNDDRIQSITLEQTSSSNQLVIQLKDTNIQTRLSYLASQNAYLLEADTVTPSSKLESKDVKILMGGMRPGRGRKWHHITVDPGHGGLDRGALIGENLYEKQAALAIAKRVRWALQTKLGVEVTLSRSEDQSLSLEERVSSANKAESDLFLSIHIGNWSHNHDSKSYVYVGRKASNGRTSSVMDTSSGEELKGLFVPWEQVQSKSLSWSCRLAEILQAEVNRTLNGGGVGLVYRHAPLKLLYSLSMPAILLEIGNGSHQGFRQIVNDVDFQNAVAATVTTAIEKFRAIYERP